MENIRNFLRNKGINPSIQRIKILKYLREYDKEHPSADEIYNTISEEIPTLSKTTVYNTMQVLAEKGIVNTICLGEGEVRFDIVTEPHVHFRCTSCDRVFDIDFDSKVFDMKKINSHRVERIHVYFTGTCNKCMKKKKT